MFQRQNKKNGGFSLIELIVATGLFTIVMTMSVSALITIVDGNRKAQALKLAMNNLNFTLEGMSRTIRIGTNYRCISSGAPTPPTPPPSQIQSPGNCPSGGNLLAFEPFEGNSSDPSDQMVFRYVRSGGGPTAVGRIERSTNGGNTYIPMTAPEVNITDFSFYVTGATDVDSLQPRVVMTISVEAGAKEKVRTEFSLQTMVSQRILDI